MAVKRKTWENTKYNIDLKKKIIKYIYQMSEKQMVAKIIAEWVSRKQVSYVCPYCWTKINKDGKPAKNAVNLTHTHANVSGKTDNQVINKSSHCPVGNGANIDIHVTDKTKRVEKSKIGNLIEDGVYF